MASAMKHDKRFAPLDPARSNASDAPPLKGIVFDVDGTLWYVSRIHMIIAACLTMSSRAHSLVSV